MKEVWAPEKRLSYLPDSIREFFIQESKFLYEELSSKRLSVVLTPAPVQTHHDHKIRVADSHNPEWYSHLYSLHNRGKRKLFEKALERIVNGLDRDLDIRTPKYKYQYDTAFRDLIYHRLTEGYSYENSIVFPNNEVRAFFGFEKMELPEEEYKIPF